MADSVQFLGARAAEESGGNQYVPVAATADAGATLVGGGDDDIPF